VRSKAVHCTIVVTPDGKVRYRDSLERDGGATLAADRNLTALLERVRDWLRQPAAEELFTSNDLTLFGQLLLSYLLPADSEARDELERTLHVAVKEVRPLRLSLIFDGNVAASSWPWELLVLPCSDGPRFLCSHPPPNRNAWASWIARRQEHPRDDLHQRDDGGAEPPACPRVLLAVADVPGQNFRLVAGSALDELVRLRDRRQIELDDELARPGEPTGEPTLRRLERKLKADVPPHVVHIIAHGDPRHIKLHAESSERRTRGDIHEISPNDLAGALAGRSPALVYLDACRTVEDGGASPFVRQLLDARVPAVLGMQYAISNQDAQSFGQQFYRTAFTESIDVAVNQARQVLIGRRRFAAPVLYLGGEPGQRLAAARSELVDCPSARCRLSGTKLLPNDTYCEMCDSELAPCPKSCGALVLKGSAACRNCRKPEEPQGVAVDVAAGIAKGTIR
jgi:CHAT domain